MGLFLILTFLVALTSSACVHYPCYLDYSNSLDVARAVGIKGWLERINSVAQLELGYSANYTDDHVCHSIGDVGDFCGRDVAKEYDGDFILNLQQVLGFLPIISINPEPADLSSCQYVAANVIKCGYFVANISTAFNFATGKYDTFGEGFRMTEYFVYPANSWKLLIGFTVQDPAAVLAYGTGVFPPSFMCANFIFPFCNVTNATGYNYLQDATYTSIEQCYDFMVNVLPLTNVCPYPSRSNTSICRNTHAIVSYSLPGIHCKHTRPNSGPCVDTCLPACANCHANAHCEGVFDIPNDFTPSYKCVCNQGYVGNGLTCQPLQCQSGNCPVIWHGSSTCSSGNLCQCTSTFTYKPEGAAAGNLCDCPAPSQVIWQNNVPTCVPQGRCLQSQWECSTQTAVDYNSVKCTMNNWTNPFTLFKFCMCNYGYVGGMEVPCFCNSPRSVKWSGTLNTNVCLLTTECTVNWHCSGNKVCVIPTGQQIGTCTTQKRSVMLTGHESWMKLRTQAGHGSHDSHDSNKKTDHTTSSNAA